MDRPDPDELLEKLQRDQEKKQRGRLKIFFGASAGSGKTYAMLQAAHRRREDGVDVVVGVVETHGRKETMALLEGLDVLPRKDHDHRGRPVTEFDLDGALERRPQLILIDELAHSNVRGARHTKRWQDVHELLESSVDVYTTVNVQHLESLNDIVGKIIGIRVWETVPDRVFDMADEVTLIDIPAEELLDRLRDGKVYMPQQAEQAVRNFFRKGNLIALRELALRRTADRVDAQMREYRADQSIDHIWQATERLIVCVGPGPESASLVRAASRLAKSHRADWLAVYVETPRLQRLPDRLRKRTLDALKLAAELGAETLTLDGTDPAQTLVAYARMRNVSKLIAGARPHAGWRQWLSKPFGDRLVQYGRDFDVTLIGTVDANRASQPQEGAPGFASLFAGDQQTRHSAYGWAVAIGAAITVVANTVLSHIDLANLAMLYLLGVIFAATRLGRGPGVLLSFLSVAAFDFFFVPPRLTFAVSDSQYLVTFAVMLLTSLTISHLTSSLRHQVRLASLRERRTAVMYAVTRELGAALTTDQIIEIATRHVSEVFEARMAILLPDSAEKVRQKVDQPDPDTTLQGTDLDLDVAQWVYDQQKAAGLGTDTLPSSKAYYLPLRAPMRTRGVMGLLTARAGELALPEQQRLIETFASQIALALERVHYVAIAQDALVNMESERLRNSLLSAISHDLRTPLTAIVGLASVLAEQVTPAQPPAQQAVEMIGAIHEEALHMAGLVNNLLDMARLQESGVRLNQQWSMLEEVVGAALAACRRMLDGHAVRTHVPADLPLVKLDVVLIERLFANLLENAAKYSTPGSPIAIEGVQSYEGADLVVKVSVSDEGPGLPTGMEARVFEKFTRGDKESSKPGVGLGLAICRAIVEAHGGKIGAGNRMDALGHVIGACVWFTLPASDAPLTEEAGEGPDAEAASAAHDVQAGRTL